MTAAIPVASSVLLTAACDVPSDCLSYQAGDLAVVSLVDGSVVPSGSRDNSMQLCIDTICTARQFDVDAHVVDGGPFPRVDVVFSDLALPEARDVDVRLTVAFATSPGRTELSGTFTTQQRRTDCGADSVRLTIRSGSLEQTASSGR